jgi:hypothetical protein
LVFANLKINLELTSCSCTVLTHHDLILSMFLINFLL